MTLSLIAAALYRRSRAEGASTLDHLQGWRELPLELAASFNPYSSCEDHPFCAKLDEYFPGGIVTLTIGGHPFKLDHFQVEPATGDVRYSSCVAPASEGHGLGSEMREALRVEYQAAGWSFAANRNFASALRAFLNALRLCESRRDINAAITYRLVAACLVELDDIEQASVEQTLAAEVFLGRGEPDHAAEAFTEAGLMLMQRMAKGARYPGLLSFHPLFEHYTAVRCFQKAKTLYTSLGEYSSASRSWVLERDANLASRRGLPRRLAQLVRLLWLYGESPAFIVFPILSTLFLCTLVYLSCGFKHGDARVDFWTMFGPDGNPVKDAGTALYFSVVTMTTLGYGDCLPDSAVSRWTVGAEALSGIFFAAMFIVTLQRRFVGR